MVTDTGAISTCENASSGTCPAFANTEEDEAAPVTPAAAVPGPPLVGALVRMLVAAVPAGLTGPRDSPLVDDPPATKPLAPVVEPTPVRTYRSRRSCGFF